MSKPFTLQPLLDVMQNRTDEASRRLGQLIAAEQSQKSRLELLEQYRTEYTQQMRDATSRGITRLVLHNYQDFLARIDLAIEQQRIAVRNSEAGTRHGQEAWQTENRKLKAIDALSQRHDARQRYQEGKQEQKLQDEFTARRYCGQDNTDPI